MDHMWRRLHYTPWNVFLCVLLFDNGSWNGCRMLCSALELKGKLWTNLRKVYVTFICDWSSLSFANNSFLIAEGERMRRQINESFRTSGDVSGVKCVNTEQIFILCASCSHHTWGSLSSSHLKRPWQGQACQVAQQMALCSPSFPLTQCFRSTKNPLGEESAAFCYLTSWRKLTSHFVNPHYFILSLLVASWELKDKGYCVPAADMHCISWLVIHPAVLLPGKLMLLPFGVFCPQCSGCHMYGLFHGLPVYQMEQLFSCTPILYICFSSSNQSLTHFHTFCYSFLKCLYASRI